MKFEIIDWCGGCREQIEKLGYKTGQIHDNDIFEVAKKIFEGGLNVMIVRYSKGNNDDVAGYLAVDTKRFQQR